MSLVTDSQFIVNLPAQCASFGWRGTDNSWRLPRWCPGSRRCCGGADPDNAAVRKPCPRRGHPPRAHGFRTAALSGAAAPQHRRDPGHQRGSRQELSVPRHPKDARGAGRFTMNCESVTKLIPLYFYGELPPEEEDSLEQHLDTCAACARQAESQRVVSAAFDRREMQPSAALLAECRHRLMRTVYRQESSVLRPVQPAAPLGRLGAWLPSLGAWRMPLGASALLALGFVSARLTAPGAA